MTENQMNIESIYPSAPRLQISTAQEFRLVEIRRLNDLLGNEVVKRKKLYNRYKRLTRICNGTSHGLTGFITMTALTGIGLFSTPVGIPVAAALELIAASGGLASIILNLCAVKLEGKAEKHERIGTLAISKANSIGDLTKKALEDNHISDAEYQLIMKENEKFNEMKKMLKKNMECDRAQIFLEELKKHRINKS
jgi:hypothetical protein